MTARNLEPEKEKPNTNIPLVVLNLKTKRWLESQQSRMTAWNLEPEKERDGWTKRCLESPQLRMTEWKLEPEKEKSTTNTNNNNPKEMVRETKCVEGL